MLKLTRHIFSWTGDAAVADYYERALLNGIIGTMNPKDGMTMYYVPLAGGYWKMFGLPRQSFWCCTGTGVENFSKLQDSIYFHGDRTLFVNLYVPSLLNWQEQGITVRQETRFPDDEHAQLLFHCDRPSTLEVRVRIPYWSESAAVKVNGKAIAGVKSGSYLAIQRTWKSGDKIDLTLPMKLHVSATPDDPNLQAFLYGPLVLAGRLGSEGLTLEAQSSDRTQQVKSHFVRGNPVPVPELRSAPVKAPGEPLTFRAGDVALVPFNRVFEERYAVYWSRSRT
jgi:DUF1680 family protein